MTRDSQLLLAPIGPMAPMLLHWLGKRLEEVFGQPYGVGQEMVLPPQAYNPRRGQYLSDELLVRLQALEAPQAWRVLGLVDDDLYTPGLNFVFGQASLAGRDAVIALARLRPSFYGRPEDEDLFRERVLKESVHELGHTLGLSHCPDSRCVMHFSNTLADTDFKGVHFCRRCAERAGLLSPGQRAPR